MTLASAAFGFGQPLRPNLMFLAGVLALGRVLWWIRTLHIQIRRSRDHFLHVGFLSPPVSAECPTELNDVISRDFFGDKNYSHGILFNRYHACLSRGRAKLWLVGASLWLVSPLSGEL